MKLAVNVINFGPGARPETLGRWAEVAEQLGYHALMISDHVASTADVEARYPAPFYDPFVALAWLAARTRRIALGTTVVIVPYRHPLLTARLVSNVDQLSGGRLILGVGAGWARQEFEALGVPFERRGAITNEYLQVIRDFLVKDALAHAGRFVSFPEVRTAPRPARAPHPPIWVGGASDAALTRAVRFGDAWHPIRISMPWLRDEGLPRLAAIAAREGRPAPPPCPRIKLKITDSPLPDDARGAGQGTLEQVHRDLSDLRALGAPYVLLDTYHDDPEATRDHEPAWRTLRTIAERVFDLAREDVR